LPRQPGLHFGEARKRDPRIADRGQRPVEVLGNGAAGIPDTVHTGQAEKTSHCRHQHETEENLAPHRGGKIEHSAEHIHGRPRYAGQRSIRRSAIPHNNSHGGNLFRIWLKLA
jgi:hypothetical protein